MEDQNIDAVVELKSVIDESVATKADKADLEGLVKSDDLEGFVKAEEAEAMVEKAVDEVTEKFEAKFDSLPAIHSKGETNVDTFKFEKMDFNGTEVIGKSFEVSKAQYDNTDVAGSRVSSMMPWHRLYSANIFRQKGTVLPVSAGSFKVPQLSAINWASEATHPGNTARNAGGTMASTTTVIENWVSENAFSIPSLEDVDGMDNVIVDFMMQRLAAAEAGDAVSVLKAASFADVNTGVATGLPTAANVIGRLALMQSELSPAYLPNAEWYVSRELMAVLQQSNVGTGSALNFDPKMGIYTLWGRPINVVEYLEAGNAAGHHAAYFGDMQQGLILGSRSNVMIGRYEQTRPGAMTYFGDARFKNAVADTNALIALNTAS